MSMTPESPQAVESAAADSRDATELKKFGYTQELKRTMGGFSSFAVSFSLISITTGILANFQVGIREAGPAVIWSWTLVVAGQLLIALVLAELAARIPLTGYGYQWSSRLVSADYGFFVGWLLILQCLTGFPGVCSTLATYLRDYIWGGELASPISIPWLTVVAISAAALVNLFGLRIASRINDAGVVTEIAGSMFIALGLLAVAGFSRKNGAAFLFNSTNHATGGPADLGAFARSLLMGAWCLTGFEAAADLAEETHNPRKTVPRAILSSLVSSGLGGILMLLGLILAISDLSAIQRSESPVIEIITASLGNFATRLVMLSVFVSFFACGLALLAMTTRLIYSMARDNMLPFSATLRRVDPETRAPVAAILFVWFASSIVVLALGRLELITSIATVAGDLAYGGIVLAALLGFRRAPSGTGFSLGRWRGVIGIAALVWTVIVAAALTVPASADGKHLPAQTTAIAIGAGIVFYFALVRPRIRSGTAGPPSAGQTR